MNQTFGSGFFMLKNYILKNVYKIKGKFIDIKNKTKLWNK